MRLLRGVGALAAVAVVAVVTAWLLRDGMATEVVAVPEPGEVAAERLADGSPVLVVHDTGGAVRVLDARTPGDRVRLLVTACEEAPLLAAGPLAAGLWTREGRPVQAGAADADVDLEGPPPDPPGPLLRYELAGPPRGDAVALGDRLPPDELEPVAPDAAPQLRCRPDADAAHDPPVERRPLEALAGAEDGRYAVDAMVEWRHDEPLRLCRRPSQVEVADGGGFRDGRGVLPVCGDAGVELGWQPGGLELPPPDTDTARAWAGWLEVAVEDGALVEVAIPADSTWLQGPTGGQVVVRGRLQAPRDPDERLPAFVWPRSDDDAGGLPAGYAVAMRGATVVDGPDSDHRVGRELNANALWLADGAEVRLPDGAPADVDRLLAALDDGALDDVAYEATIDRVTGETVTLVPAP